MVPTTSLVISTVMLSLLVPTMFTVSDRPETEARTFSGKGVLFLNLKSFAP